MNVMGFNSFGKSDFASLRTQRAAAQRSCCDSDFKPVSGQSSGLESAKTAGARDLRCLTSERNARQSCAAGCTPGARKKRYRLHCKEAETLQWLKIAFIARAK